jgi:hypothetical protein
MLGVVLAATALGCALFTGRSDERLAFSHAVHVQEQGLECINCHEDASVSDTPGMPAPETCETCHVQLDEAKPEERRVAALFEDDVFRAVHASALADELVFSHLRHTEALEDCSACHRGIESNARIEEDKAFAMDDCTDCHAEKKVANECATCHTRVDTAWPPPSHQHSWKQQHGMVVRSKSQVTADSCVLCHQESSCTECHMIEAPQSHTNTWRQRTHGIQARMDRNSCSACHLPDACDACHAETRPRSHTGSFGAPRSRHCLGCHFPLRNEGCVTCHKETPSHQRAKPKPAWHTPAMNCRGCHGSQQPLPHVDKGDDCNLCHL